MPNLLNSYMSSPSAEPSNAWNQRSPSGPGVSDAWNQRSPRGPAAPHHHNPVSHPSAAAVQHDHHQNSSHFEPHHLHSHAEQEDDSVLKDLITLLESRCYNPGNLQFNELPSKAQEGISLIFEAASTGSHHLAPPPPPPQAATVQSSTMKLPVHSAPSYRAPSTVMKPIYTKSPSAPSSQTFRASLPSTAFRGMGYAPPVDEQSSDEEEESLFSPDPQKEPVNAEELKTKPCNNYELDMLGSSYGVCKCGHSRASHLVARGF